MIFFTLLGINTLFTFAMFSTRPIVPIYAEAIGANSLIIGLLVSSYSFLPMLLAVQAGRWVDRIGARKTVLWGGSGLLLSFVLPLFLPRLSIIFISQLIFGFSQLFVILSIQKTVGNLPGNRDKLISSHSLSAGMGDMLGPLVSGFTYTHFGFRFTFAIAAAAVLAAVLFSCVLKSGAWKGTAQVSNDLSAKEASTWLLLKNVNLRKSLIISGIGLYSKELMTAYFPLYATKLGMSASTIGILLSISALMSLIVRFMQFQLVQKFGRTYIMTMALFIGAAAYMLVSLFHSPIVLAVIIAFMGASLGIGQPLSIVYALNHSPPERHGEVLGIRLSVNRILQFTAPILFGGLGGFFGLYSIFVTNGIIMMTGAFFTRIQPSTEEKKSEPTSRYL